MAKVFDIFNIKKQKTTLQSQNEQLTVGIENDITAQKSIVDEDNVISFVKGYLKKNAFFPVFDAILVSLEKRVSPESLQMATAVDQFCQLNFEESVFFVDHFKVSIDLSFIKMNFYLHSSFLFLKVILYFIYFSGFQDLMCVSKYVLKSEMAVAKNCILQSTDEEYITSKMF